MVDEPGKNDEVEPETEDVEGHSVEEEETGDADMSNFNVGCCC